MSENCKSLVLQDMCNMDNFCSLLTGFSGNAWDGTFIVPIIYTVDALKLQSLVDSSCLIKMPRQIMQTQIRLLLKKFNQGLSICYVQPQIRLLLKNVMLTSILGIPALITHILFENRKRKILKIFPHKFLEMIELVFIKADLILTQNTCQIK